MKKIQSTFILSLAVALIYLATSCTTTLPEGTDTAQSYIPEDDFRISRLSRASEVEVQSITQTEKETFDTVVESSVTVDAFSEETQIAQPLQITRYIGLDNAYDINPELFIDNETYYALIHLDIFSEQMYKNASEPVDLLSGEALNVWESTIIDLSQFPTLLSAILQEPEATFIVNAVDTQHNLYLRTWRPSIDLPSIAISEALLDETYEIPGYVEWGERLLISNRTGYPLTELYLVEFDPQRSSFEDEINLLGTQTLSNLKSVTIALEKLPYIEMLTYTFDPNIMIYGRDSDGDWYMHSWFPDLDPWTQDLRNWDLVFDSPLEVGASTYIRINNHSPVEIWYLYLSETPTLEDHFMLDDLLTSGILSIGQAIKIPLAEIPNEPLYLVGYDYDENEYFYYWDPADGLYLTFDDENIIFNK